MGDVQRLLTEEEQVIVDLVLSGRTNQSIAERLYLSKRSLEVRLTDIYTALGVTGKADLRRSRTIASRPVDPAPPPPTPVTPRLPASPSAASPSTASPATASPKTVQPGVDTLDPEERAILDLLLDGHTNADIAARLYLSKRSIELRLTSLYRAVGVRRKSELRGVLEAWRAGNEPSAPTLEVRQEGDLTFLRVVTPDLDLTFLPDVGGRLISWRTGAHEWLWHNPRYLDDDLAVLVPASTWPDEDISMSSWLNLGGSKSWPAPQAGGNAPSGADAWDGPPDPVLDRGAYAWTSTTDGAVRVLTMTSAPDPRSGLQVRRTFRVPAFGAEVEQSVRHTNVSGIGVQWSIWEICQVDTDPSRLPGARIEVTVGDAARVTDLGCWDGRPTVRHDDAVVAVGIDPVVAKWGFPDATGSIALVAADGSRLALHFDVEPEAVYPDQGSRAEIWMQHPTERPIATLDGWQPDAWLAELEVLSPLHVLAPGEHAEMQLRWSVSPGG